VKRSIALATLAACWGSSPVSLSTDVAGVTLAQARSLEYGRGVSRDYRKAAAIYDRLCADGRGSMEACHDLADAIRDGRGVSVDRRRLGSLTSVLCERADAAACLTAAIIEQADSRGAANVKLSAAVERAEHACAKADGRACLLVAELDGGSGSQAEHAQRLKYNTACRAGLVDACRNLTAELGTCGEPDVGDPAACEERLLTEWRAHGEVDRVHAVGWLQEACASGDARACSHLPSRRLTRAELCASHDFNACAALGCTGDDAADKLARIHGVTAPNCHVAGKAAHLEWRRKPEGLPPIVADRRPATSPRPTPPFDAIRATHHGGRDRKGWPRYDLYNRSDQAVLDLIVCAYAYDASINQIARAELSPAELPLPPGAIVQVELARGTGTIPELTSAAVQFEISYQRVGLGSQPTATDHTRCPVLRPAGSPHIYGW
jgi:TPR repeat protein